MSGADFLQLDRAHAPAGDLAGWLADAVHAAASDGRLPVGSRLPASRLLARDLGVSRGVVVAAYQRLVDSGVALGAGAAGTRIAARPSPAPEPAGPVVTDTDRVDLTPGVPDLAAFPRAAWLRAEREILVGTDNADLGYGDPRGHPVLRRELAAWLGRTRGVRAAADDIVVVAGVAQALALLARVLGERTRIAVEDPGSQGAREQIAFWGLDPVPVPVDEHGVDVDALCATGVRAALLTPAHQFPTGVVLAPDRRRALLDWARSGGLVIEDDYDAEHRYDRAPVPALQGLAPAHVVHVGSVSKTLAPGMRIGWMVLPEPLREPVAHLKSMADLGNAALPQLVLARLIATGQLERHVRRVRPRQRARRDAMLDALARHLPDARVHGVAAGMHLLVTLGAGDDRELAARARDVGVVVHALSRHRVAPGPPGLVLGYAAQPPDRIRDGIARLAAAR
ncbi:PLP-dependent aminotransferase family protein [Pseudonocardia abyssalis]|uniref:PLP-dependent aminotransferase family protein n=4 Tax=Pseudonocardia abyssalis TaxID=2792008 RepID=A0ABS6UQQ7_9PSEU|nr:PLP-dependent aminotransferase family protein [Pseudonocardia abyssalis]